MKKRRVGLLVAWLAATTIATVLASQAVALVRDQVTDRPSRVATTFVLETSTTTTVAPVTTDRPPTLLSTTTTLAETATTTLDETTTTQPVATTTSVPTTTTPTTTAAPTNQEETFFLTGGWATVRCAGNEVMLATYAPNPGYQVEIESPGPIELEIKFEEAGGDHRSKLEVHCSNGVLDPKVEERDDD